MPRAAGPRTHPDRQYLLNNSPRWQVSRLHGSAGSLSADGNGDGTVDAADYVVWRRHQGASVFGDGAASALEVTYSTVPEPLTALLACWALLVVVARGSERAELPLWAAAAKVPACLANNDWLD